LANSEEYDPEALARLMKRLGDVNDFTRPQQLVTLAEFFEGNNDWGSIGYNCLKPQSPQEWYRFLKGIASRPDVHDVRIEVQEQPSPDRWPFTETIWVITTASPDDVRAWFPEHMHPDDIFLGLDRPVGKVQPYDIPAGYTAVGLWYD
jgi:hypothetical protein